FPIAELPESVQLLRVRLKLFEMPPPPSLAKLPESVQLLRARSPKLAMPPPWPANAELPESVQLLRVSVLSKSLNMPPANSSAELSATMQLLRLSVPLFQMPPAKDALPPVRVTPAMLTTTVLSKTVKTRSICWALIMVVSAPAPWIVTSLVKFKSPEESSSTWLGGMLSTYVPAGRTIVLGCWKGLAPMPPARRGLAPNLSAPVAVFVPGPPPVPRP